MTMLVAGIILIIAGLLRLGTYIKYIPYPVVTGFTAGIGALLISTQVKDLLGLQMESVPSDFLPKWQAYFANLGNFSFSSVFIAAFSFAAIFYVRHKRPNLPAYLSPSSAPRCWLRCLRCSPPRRIPSAPNSVPSRTSCLRRNCRNLTSI